MQSNEEVHDEKNEEKMIVHTHTHKKKFAIFVREFFSMQLSDKN